MNLLNKSAARMFALVFFGMATHASAAETIEVRTQADPGILQPEGKLWGQLPFFNVPVELSPQKPAAVKKVPVARGAMVFGSVSVGDLDSQSILVALDRESDGPDAEADRRLYIDSNQNGDLTDDGDGTWFQFVARGSRFKASTAGRTVTVRYASGESEPHGLYFVYAVPRADGGPQLSYRRGGARTGVIGTDQKNIPFVLIENNGRAVYNDSDAERPLWIMLDLNADGAFATEERYDARRSMIIGDTVYELRASASGSKLAFVPTTRAPQIPSAPRATRARPDAARPPLLAVGSAAPDFVVEKAGGGTMKLSDLRGQVVVLDFWATWCGPCKASMPSLEELHGKTKAQGVTVFGVCVWDTREKFDAWMKEPPVKTTYLKAFDPAGVNRENGNAESIAKKFYKVSGIPTFYVIDRDGKIAAAFVGNSATSKQGLKETLVKLGMSL